MGKNKDSFIKKAAILAAAGLIVRFIGFLYRVPLIRLIGDIGNAYYSAAYSIYNFVYIVSSAGLPAAISKMVSERMALNQHKNARRVFEVSMVFAIIVGLICAIFVFLGAERFANATIPGSRYAIMSLAPTILIVAIMSVFRGYFQGLNIMVPTAISQIIEQIFNASSSLLLAYLFFHRLRMGEEMGACGGTMGTGIGALAGLFSLIVLYFIYRPMEKKYLARDTDHYRENKKDITKKLLNIAFPIVIGSAVFSISTIIDTRMVVNRLEATGLFTTEKATEMFGILQGKYVTMVTLPVALSTALATASVPNISASATIKDHEGVKRKINTALRVSMILAVPSAVGLGVLGVPIIQMLFKGSGGELLRVGAISIVFLSLAQIATGILQGLGKVYIPAISAIGGAFIKVSLNYILIANPKFNIYGALISTIICYVITSGINLTVILNITKTKLDFFTVFFKPFISAVAMGLCCYSMYWLVWDMISSNAIAVMTSISFGVLVYFIMMILVKGFASNDILLLPKGKKLLNFLKKRKLI